MTARIALLSLLLASNALAQEGPPLEQWIASALEKNPSRSISRAALLTAEANRLQAASTLLPTVRAQASYTYNDRKVVLPFDFDGPGGEDPVDIVITPWNSQDAFVTARVPIIDPPGFARWRAARHAAAAATQDDRASEIDVALDVARDYYAAVAAQQVLRAAERAKSVADENARIVQARLNAGATTPLLADRADLEVSRAEQIVIDARRGWQAAIRALSSASGLPEPSSLAAPAPATDPAPSEESLLATAEKSRPELAAARAKSLEAKRARGAAWASYGPNVYATGTERYTNATGFSGRKDTWSVGVTAEWLLLEGGQRSADLKRERASILRANALLEQQRLAVRDEVHSAWLDVEAARAKLVASRRGDEVSQRAAEETRTRFKAGTATQLDVIQSDRDALQAQVDRIRAEGELSIARLALKRAAGEPIVAAR